MKKELKKRAVKEKGGCCLLCGYARCLSALHFHHVNSFEKSFNISDQTNWSKIEQELDKCVLLCATCHKETHSGMVDVSIFEDLEF